MILFLLVAALIILFPVSIVYYRTRNTFSGWLAVSLFILITILLGLFLISSRSYVRSTIKLSESSTNNSVSLFQNRIRITPSAFISGNCNRCFYHALSQEFFGTQDRWHEIRKVVDSNIERYLEDLDYSSFLGVANREEFLEKFGYSDPSEVMIAKVVAAEYQRPIVVYGLGQVFVFETTGEYQVFDYDTPMGFPTVLKALEFEGSAKLFMKNNHYEIFTWALI